MRVFLTGGSRGIGLAIKNTFEKNKHTVFSPTRQQLDLTKEVNLSDNKFDIVINNAGINPLNGIMNVVGDDVMRVNYTSPLKIIQCCLPYMVSNNFGRIVNIGSIWIDVAKSDRLAYSASKSALHSLTKYITAEYAKFGILANTISPGYIATELTYKNNTEQDIKSIVNKVPVGRLGTPEEVAKLVYQMTVENTFISGQNIIIDGGFTCVA